MEIRHCMLSNFLILNSNKTNILLGLHTARSKLCDYVVTLNGHSVTLCATVKDLGVMTEAHAHNITRIAFFHNKAIS